MENETPRPMGQDMTKFHKNTNGAVQNRLYAMHETVDRKFVQLTLNGPQVSNLLNKVRHMEKRHDVTKTSLHFLPKSDIL